METIQTSFYISLETTPCKRVYWMTDVINIVDL